MTVEEAIEIIERSCGVQSDTLSCAAMILVARIKELEAERAELLGRIEGRPSRSNCTPPTVQHDPELPTPPEVTG